jgi:hypothetical protein
VELHRVACLALKGGRKQCFCCRFLPWCQFLLCFPICFLLALRWHEVIIWTVALEITARTNVFPKRESGAIGGDGVMQNSVNISITCTCCNVGGACRQQIGPDRTCRRISNLRMQLFFRHLPPSKFPKARPTDGPTLPASLKKLGEDALLPRRSN